MNEIDPFRSARLILALRQAGVTDRRILSAIEKTPRETFVPADFLDMAYDDAKLPIDCGQELTRPTMVGRMLQGLQCTPTCNVLEIGSGTGYQAAILSRLSRRVFSIDRYRMLVERAKAAMRGLELRNVELRLADGLLGWPEAAPFDRIILSGSVGEPSAGLLAQLAPGGVLVAPVDRDGEQYLSRYDFDENEQIRVTVLGPSKFLPLINGVAREL